MNNSANLLLDEISDFASVSRMGKIYDEYLFSHIYHLIEPYQALSLKTLLNIS